MNRKGLWLVGIVVLLVAASVFYVWLSRPDWDPSPNRRLVSFEPGQSKVDYNYIPDFQVWGDGRIVWVERAEDWSRQVFEGRLSQAQLDDLHGMLSAAGFFNPFIGSQGLSLRESVRVRLNNGESSSRDISPGTQVFDLANYLRKGAGATGKDFVPVQGDFYVFLASEVEDLSPNAKPQYKWLDNEFEYTLESVYKNGGQTEITGDELAFAWTIVNSPAPLVVSNGVTYWIAIIVPGISD